MAIERHDLESAGIAEYETPREAAQVWIGYLRMHIAQFEALHQEMEIDLERAVRGAIIGDISGDAVNDLLGAHRIAEHGRGSLSQIDLIVRVGWLSTWEKITGSIEEFGERLPPSIRDEYLRIFAVHLSKTEALSQNSHVDLEAFAEGAMGLYSDLYAIKSMEGFDPNDITYALGVKRFIRAQAAS